MMKTLCIIHLLFWVSVTQAGLVVSGDHLVVTSGKVKVIGTTDLSGRLLLENGTEWITGDMLIRSSGTLEGCGTVSIAGTLTNEGLILANCGDGFALNLASDVQNATGGVIRARSDTAVLFASSVVNLGILDLIFSPSEPPVSLTGTGTTVTESTLPPMKIDAEAGMLFIPAFAGHIYQVQYTTDLSASPVSWSDIGSGFSVPVAETKPVPLTNTVERIQYFRYFIQ